jgi:hypothetical protein
MADTSIHRGTSALEVLVSLTLLTSTLTLSLPLVVRHGRLLVDQRDYRVALDELSNQLDRLAALPESEMQAARENLAVSEFAAARLPDAKLSGGFEPADIGGRLTLRLTWGRSKPHEISMAAWIIPRPPQINEEPPTE